MLYIDLEQKTVKDGNIYLIYKGQPQNGYVLDDTIITFEYLETLYNVYKHSVPNSKTCKKCYFKALSYDELSTKDLITGENREKSKEKLELAVITGVLNKSLVWPDETKWFLQSENDKDFVILKKWITI